MKFSKAIDPCGVYGFGFGTGGVAGGATEDVVGGDVDEPTAAGLDGVGEVLYGGGVEELGSVEVAFGFVDVRIGGAVDDDVDGVAVDGGVNSLAVGDVELADIGKDVAVGAGWGDGA